MKIENVNLKDYANITKALKDAIDGNDYDKNKAKKTLKERAAKIFLFDKNGDIIMERRGIFNVPSFRKLYVILNLKRTAAFLVSLYVFVIAILDKEEVPKGYGSFGLNTINNAEDEEDNNDKDIENLISSIKNSEKPISTVKKVLKKRTAAKLSTRVKTNSRKKK